MIKTGIFILIIYSLLSSDFLFAAGKTKAIKPVNADKETILIISGKSKTYYPLSSKKPLLLNAKGPAKLKIITRVQFNSKDKETLDYSVYYRVDGTEKIKADFENIKRSVDAEFKDENSGKPGVGEEIELNLSRGEHTIEIWQADEKHQIHSRFLLTKVREKKIDWVSLSPLYPNEPVNLVTNENVVSYYRFSGSKPLKVKITGPTVLRILSRVENHYFMKGRINYRIQVKEDGVIKNTYLLNSVRSEVTVYKKGCNRTPGKAKEILIDVPKGKHVYTIIPLDKDKSTLLGRVLFPKKDVKIKER